MRLRNAVLIVSTVAALAASAGMPAAQSGARRAATPSALLNFPGFFHGQPVVVRGDLATRDRAVLMSSTAPRSIPLIFTGPSPADGPVEIRATFWDVGRFQHDDPRVQNLGLDRLLSNNAEGEWPKPGDVVALIVTDVMAVKPDEGIPSLRAIALDPARYAGQRVKVTGQFHGRNLYGELPQGPSISQWDFALHAADAAVWVTGLRPKGKDFDLAVDKRVDTGKWLEATGVVREGRGLVWIEAQQLAAAKPDVDTRNAETPPTQLVGPPPQVIFSDPEEGETDVALKAVVRLQFSRDMNPETFKGRVHWKFAPTAGQGGPAIASAELRDSQVRYDGAKRSVEIHIDAGEAATFRQVVIELADGVAATDGAELKPWSLTFAFGSK